MQQRNLVLTGFFIFVFLIFAGVLFLRVSVRRLLESSELNSLFQTTMNGLVYRWNPEMKVELPRLKTTGFLSLELTPIKVIPALGQDPFTLHLRARVDGFASVLWGQPLELLGTLSTDPGDDAQDAVVFKSSLSFSALYGLLTAWEPAVFKSQLGRFFQKPLVELRRLGPRWIESFLAEKGSWPKPKMLSGELSGQVFLAPPEAPTLLRLDLTAAEWVSSRFDKLILRTDPMRLEAQWLGSNLTLKAPLVLALSLGIKGSPAALQNNLLFAGKDGLLNQKWTLTLTGEMRLQEGAFQYDLEGNVKGGSLTLLAAGRLLRCRTSPMRNFFKITGPMAQPECS